MGTLQLGQFQPTLQSEWSARQLIGLVNLSLLLSDSILLHDTQLLDNPHVLEAFRTRYNSSTGVTIFRQIREGISQGLIDIGIRDGMLITPDEFVECQALEDVAGAWIRQRLTGVGRVRNDLPFRADVLELARDLDWTVERGSRRPIQYNYIDVKSIFQDRIRQNINTDDSPMSAELARLPVEFAVRYHAIVNRQWFSHTDLFHLVKDYDAARDLMMMQGYTDEGAYSSFFGVELSGSDRRDPKGNESAERLFVPGKSMGGAISIDDLLGEHASRIIEGPSIDVLSLLEIPDILELRALGSDVRALRARTVDGLITKESEDTILGAFDDYWKAICDHIRKRYPMSSRRPTRILILLRKKFPRIADIFVKGTRFAHQVAPEIVKALPVPPGAAPVTQVASGYVGLEFLLFTEDDALRALRKSLPRSTWRVMVGERRGTGS